MAENPNALFARLFPLPGPIVLSETGARRAVLSEADTNGDGVVTMREARDRLIQQSRVLSDPRSKTFKHELEAFLLEKTGRICNTLDESRSGVARVCYLQFNNPDNQSFTEEKDLKEILAKDIDKPTLDTMNLTAAFNTNGDERAATQAFLRAMRDYFNGLIQNQQRMSGLVISGHSNGTDILQETDEHLYYANLDIREALTQLRDEKLEFRAILDGCEKFGALACFHGGALAEWAELLPNATLAGTQDFAPVASSHASAAIYDAAATAHQVIEDYTGKTAEARAAGENVPYVADLRRRGLTIAVPDVQDALARAKAEATAQEASYGAIAGDIQKILQAGGAGFNQGFLDRAYAVANSYYLAMNDLWICQNRPDDALRSMAKKLDRLEFERRDLFAIRKHTPRPTQNIT